MNVSVAPQVYGLSKFSFDSGSSLNSFVLEHVMQTVDVRLGSLDLGSAIRDWTTLYHLCPSRASLLEPVLPWLVSPVLEIGAGLGAQTRALGEMDLEVVALEVSQKRAEVIRERCRDLPRVSIGSGGGSDVEPSFNTVMMVGVLEYAPQHAGSRDPLEACGDLLRYAKSVLHDEGHLIIAIENQLGAQYLNGAPEDHNGTPFYGVEDRYDEGGVVTFGRLQLREMLERAGFKDQRWFYPFPDFKFPTCVLSEAGVSRSSALNPTALLRRAERLNPLAAAKRSFRLRRSWDVVWRNGLLGELSNSFLVVAGSSAVEKPKEEEEELAWVLPAVGLRTDLGAVDIVTQRETTILRKSRPLLGMSNGSIEGGAGQRQSTQSHWDRGSHVDRLVDLLDMEADSHDGLQVWFSDWLAALARSMSIALTELTLETELPAASIELIPPNLFCMQDELSFALPESIVTACDCPLTVHWLIYRGLLHSVLQVRQSGAAGRQFSGASVRSAMERIADGPYNPFGSPLIDRSRWAEQSLLLGLTSVPSFLDLHLVEELRFE